MGLGAVRGYICTADCASPNEHLKFVWGFFSCLFCLAVIRDAVFRWFWQQSPALIWPGITCKHVRNVHVAAAFSRLGAPSSLQDYNQQHPLNPSLVFSPSSLCWWLSVGPIMSLPSPPIPNPTMIPAQFPKGNAQAGMSEFPKTRPGVCHPRSRRIWKFSPSPAPQLPAVPRAATHLCGSPPR